MSEIDIWWHYFGGVWYLEIIFNLIFNNIEIISQGHVYILFTQLIVHKKWSEDDKYKKSDDKILNIFVIYALNLRKYLKITLLGKIRLKCVNMILMLISQNYMLKWTMKCVEMFFNYFYFFTIFDIKVLY